MIFCKTFSSIALSALMIICCVFSCDFVVEAADWERFRGPNGSGISVDPSPLPTSWAPGKNVRWQLDLPGPGHSCPIVVGNRIFVTCWTGYATQEAPNASIESLRRHLLCVDRATGTILWDKSYEAVLPEDPFQGQFTNHGYASHTPTSDGERVYAFFGKTGVIAFDMEGKELWRQSVGEGLSRKGWGSASSPVLYNDLVIVTASAEKNALFALDKLTGKVVWEQKADGFQGIGGTPILVKVDDSRTDLVIGVPYEVWGFDPANGNLRWFCKAIDTDSYCTSVLSDNSHIYAIAGRNGGSIAIKAGGKDDVSASHVAWRGRDNSQISTPVLYQDNLYFFSRGTAKCIDAKTGKEIFEERLQRSLRQSETSSKAVADDTRRGEPQLDVAGGGRRGEGDRGEGRREGGGGALGGGGQDCASPIIAGGLIYFVSRSGDTHVIQPNDTLKQLAINRVSDDSDEEFGATPAVSDGQLFLRSTKRLYCISN
jgi:outer membrane protein assembly factor BamB